MKYPRQIQNNITLTSTTETALLTGVSSQYLDLVSLFLSNTSASAARVDFRDATSGTVRFSLNLIAGQTMAISLTNPWQQTTAGGTWTVQLSGAVTDVRIAAQGAIRN